MKIVVFGASEIGLLVANEFFENHDVTIIDKEENRSDSINRLDIRFIAGNGSNINTLLSAKIEDADIFIACTTFDEANIVACLTVSRMSNAKTVCFVSTPEYIESLQLGRYRDMNSLALNQPPPEYFQPLRLFPPTTR